jgi:hypothetical protein
VQRQTEVRNGGIPCRSLTDPGVSLEEESTGYGMGKGWLKTPRSLGKPVARRT